jgi:hypothetical protein
MLLHTENAKQLILIALMHILTIQSYEEHPHLYKNSCSFTNFLSHGGGLQYDLLN